MNQSCQRVMKNVAILCSRIYYDKHKIDKTAKPFGSGGCSSRFVVSTVFLLHDCVCTSSLVLLPALRISHLRLRAFHQHCSEHYSCIVAMINFCLFPLQRKCKTVAACECLKVPCPTPALTVNSLHTSAMHVSFITLYPV